MQFLRHPTLHFLVMLILAPIFAIIGTSLSGFSATLVGWFVTLSLLSGFGIRSIVCEWKDISCKTQEQWPDLSTMSTIRLHLLIGIGLVTLLSFIAALIVCGMLIVDMANAITVQSHLASV